MPAAAGVGGFVGFSWLFLQPHTPPHHNVSARGMETLVERNPAQSTSPLPNPGTHVGVARASSQKSEQTASEEERSTDRFCCGSKGRSGSPRAALAAGAAASSCPVLWSEVAGCVNRVLRGQR